MDTQKKIVVDEIRGIVEVKSATVLEQSPKPSIVPPTPDPKRENVEQIYKLSSPLTLVSSPPDSLSFDSSLNFSPNENNSQTPKDSVFDPFAPGPDKFMLAPLRRKYSDGSRANAVRKLNFSWATNLVRDTESESSTEKTSDEDHLFESIYQTILDMVISEQTKEFAESVPIQVSHSDGFRTPESAPRINGVAETCPDAPVKSSSKYRNIDKDLCRKLEF